MHTGLWVRIKQVVTCLRLGEREQAEHVREAKEPPVTPPPPSEREQAEHVRKAKADWLKELLGRIGWFLFEMIGVYTLLGLVTFGNTYAYPLTATQFIHDLFGGTFSWDMGLKDSDAVTSVTTLVLLSAAICIATVAAPRALPEATLYDQVAISQWSGLASKLGWWTAGVAAGVALTRFPDTPTLGIVLLLASFAAAALSGVTAQRIHDEWVTHLAGPSFAKCQEAAAYITSNVNIRPIPRGFRAGARWCLAVFLWWVVSTVAVSVTYYLLAWWTYPSLHAESVSSMVAVGAIIVLYIGVPVSVLVFLPLLWLLVHAWSARAKKQFLLQRVSIATIALWVVSFTIVISVMVSREPGASGRLPAWILVAMPCAVAVLVFFVIVWPLRRWHHGSSMFAARALQTIEAESRYLENRKSRFDRRLSSPRIGGGVNEVSEVE